MGSRRRRLEGGALALSLALALLLACAPRLGSAYSAAGRPAAGGRRAGLVRRTATSSSSSSSSYLADLEGAGSRKPAAAAAAAAIEEGASASTSSTSASAPSPPAPPLHPVNLDLSEVKNVRDMAGVQGSGIKPGRVFRTGYISRASPSDIELLKRQGLQTLVDLRSAKEICEDENIQSPVYEGFEDVKLDKDAVPYGGWDVLRDAESGRRRYFVSLMDENIYRKGVFKRLRKRSKAKVLAFMPLMQLSKRIYRAAKRVFIRKINDGGLFLLNELILEYSGAGLARALKLLAEPSRHPLALYCTAGKDRTGLVMALALASLGVSDEKILEDYHKSDSAYRDLNDKDAMVGALNQIDLDPDVFLCAPPEVMEETLKVLREKYGGVESYLDSIGFGPNWRQRLREALTEDY